MKKFAKIINEETKAVVVGMGTNESFYRSEGMTEMDVEQGFDGAWYVAGFAPEKPQSVIDEERIAELQNDLNTTDWYVVRFAETGVVIPPEISQARAAARLEISTLRGESGAA